MREITSITALVFYKLVITKRTGSTGTYTVTCSDIHAGVFIGTYKGTNNDT